ncbi:MAG: FkbM family methyltransferase [Phycisphaeraceae bacterium]|nr:MAG: FkbM family methyltransferase [Phycisphaeraceae bacterium]
MSLLKANIGACGLEKTIIAEPLAVGDGLGFDLLESSASLNAGFRESHDEAIGVEVISLDGYISSRGVENVKTVKIDVESYERTVLAGMQTILETHRPLVFLEVLTDDVADAVREVCARYDDAAYAMDPVRLTRSAFESSMNDRNMALCPSEREDSLRSLAAGAGLGVE